MRSGGEKGSETSLFSTQEALRLALLLLISELAVLGGRFTQAGFGKCVDCCFLVQNASHLILYVSFFQGLR